MTETELQRDILALLYLAGVTAWRANSGYVKKNVKLAPSGTPDIIGYTRDGRFLGIEVKLPGKPLRTSQMEWHEKALKAGCKVFVAYSVEDVERELEEL